MSDRLQLVAERAEAQRAPYRLVEDAAIDGLARQVAGGCTDQQHRLELAIARGLQGRDNDRAVDGLIAKARGLHLRAQPVGKFTHRQVDATGGDIALRLGKVRKQADAGRIAREPGLQAERRQTLQQRTHPFCGRAARRGEGTIGVDDAI